MIKLFSPKTSNKTKLPKINAPKKPKTKIYKILYIGISTIREKTPIEIVAIKKLLVKAASIIAIETSSAEMVHKAYQQYSLEFFQSLVKKLND